MALKPLKSIDAADRAQLLRALVYFGAPCFAVLTMIEGMLRYRGSINSWEFFLLLGVNLCIAYGGARLIVGFSERSAQSFVKMVYAGHSLPYGPIYSSQESLIARGFYQEAEKQFLEHIAAHPEEAEARIRLADLYQAHLDAPDSAEQRYLEARPLSLTPRQENTISNSLIELYRKLGRRDRMKVELARFAERYRGTRPGVEAERLLKEMKQEDATESSRPP